MDLSRFLTNLSCALFLLMPVFALLLQLLYIRRKRYYIEHLIFSLNMHSFALLILSLVFALKLLLKGEDNFLYYGILIIPVYFTVGMKNFYSQGYFKILLKVLLLGLSYGFLLLIFLSTLAVLTLIWL